MRPEPARNKSNEHIATLSSSSSSTETDTTSRITENRITSESPATTYDEIEVLLIEPFYGGSHKQLIDMLTKYVPKSKLVTLTSKKWHWRARCGALVLSNAIPKRTGSERVIFCSSVLSLAELIGLRPDLGSLKKIVYFHENQMVYPMQEIKERDIQFAYNQITTCIAADLVVFNSAYNRDSFLDNLNRVLKLLPDYRPKGLKEIIMGKSLVLYFPLEFSQINFDSKIELSPNVLSIVWPHRWEFDKNPELFVETLIRLKTERLDFRVSILGETFTEVPEVLIKAKEVLKEEIVHYGFVESKTDYYKVLQGSHVVVSTARHEFYGVSMLEASYCGCYPLVPNKLVYPEIFPKECLYLTDEEFYLKLKEFCIHPELAVKCRKEMNLDFYKFSIECLLPKYRQLFA